VSNKYNSEAEIVIGCQKQKKEAQKEVYSLYFRKMSAVSYRYTNSYDDAKDIVHDSFVLVFDKIEKFKGDGSLEGWIRRIVVNKSIDFIKKKNKQRVTISEEEQQVLTDSVSQNEYYTKEAEEVGSIYTSGLTKTDIEAAIDMLRDSYKLVINMSILDSFTHKEIAEKLSITEELSRIRLKRARAALQAILIDEVKRKTKINVNETTR